MHSLEQAHVSTGHAGFHPRIPLPMTYVSIRGALFDGMNRFAARLAWVPRSMPSPGSNRPRNDLNR